MFDGGISLVPIMDTYFSVCSVRTPYSREPFTCLYAHKRLEKISLFYFFFSPNENESIEDIFTARKKKTASAAIHGQGLVGCLQADRESYTISCNTFSFSLTRLLYFVSTMNLHIMYR